jgi:hemerythrin
MRIGNQAYDDQRRDLAGLIELLDQDPTSSIHSENFLGRFHTLQVVVQEYFAREEAFIEELGVPLEIKNRHLAEHENILGIFLDIYMDSMKHKGGSAIEVYQQVREALRLHFINFDSSLRAYAQDKE